MKKLLAMLSISALIGGTAIAQDGPHIEPGPVQKLSADAKLVSRILLDRQLKDCVAEFQDSDYDVALNEVTFQALAPGKTEFQFSGGALKGGDMAEKMVVMTVLETEAEGVFGHKVKVYTCRVSWQ